MPSRVPRELSREVTGCNAFSSSAITFFGSVAHHCRIHMQVHCHCKQNVSKEDDLNPPNKMRTGLSNVGTEYQNYTVTTAKLLTIPTLTHYDELCSLG